jgi:hypothetical protein
MITRTGWTRPVEAFIEDAPATLAGVWSLLYSAAIATSELSQLPVINDDLSLSMASCELQRAAESLQWHDPHLPVTGRLLDLGPALLDDVQGCRTGIILLIRGAHAITHILLNDPKITVAGIEYLLCTMPLMTHAYLRVQGPAQRRPAH